MGRRNADGRGLILTLPGEAPSRRAAPPFTSSVPDVSSNSGSRIARGRMESPVKQRSGVLSNAFRLRDLLHHVRELALQVLLPGARPRQIRLRHDSQHQTVPVDHWNPPHLVLRH